MCRDPRRKVERRSRQIHRWQPHVPLVVVSFPITADYVRKTCRVCGHATRERREHVYVNTPEACEHKIVDRRGSTKSTSKTFRLQCGTFVDEVPQEFHKERKAAAQRMLNATADAVSTASALMADDATATLNPEAVEVILGTFTDRVNSLVSAGDPVSDASLHEVLRESITAVMEEPGEAISPGSAWDFVPTAMVVTTTTAQERGRSPARSKGRKSGKGSFSKGRLGHGSWRPFEGSKVGSGKGKQRTESPPDPSEIPNPFGNDTVVGGIGGQEFIGPAAGEDFRDFDDSLFLGPHDPYDPLLECSPTRRNDLDPSSDQYDDWVQHQLELQEAQQVPIPAGLVKDPNRRYGPEPIVGPAASSSASSVDPVGATVSKNAITADASSAYLQASNSPKASQLYSALKG